MKELSSHDIGEGSVGVLALLGGRALVWTPQVSEASEWLSSGEAVARFSTIAAVHHASELREGRLATMSGRYFQIWSRDRTLLGTSERHHGVLRGVIELRDGRFLSWACDHKPRLWNSNVELIGDLPPHREKVLGAAELVDGRLLTWAGIAHVSARDGRATIDVPGWTSSTFVFAGRDGRVVWWPGPEVLRVGFDLEAQPHATGTGAPSGRTVGARELRDGRLVSWTQGWTVVVGGWRQPRPQNEVRVWDLANGLDAILRVETPIEDVIQIGPHHLVIRTRDGDIQIRDLGGPDELWVRSLDHPADAFVGALALTDDRFLAWTATGRVEAWTSGRVLVGRLDMEEQINAAVTVDQGQTVVLGTTGGRLRFVRPDGT